jgi:phosphatidylglycerol---prolipoprotein diacylglyceryl transferase
MWPTLLELSENGAGIHTYGLLVLAGFSAAYLMIHFRAIQVGFHPDKLVAVYIAAAVGGLVGARSLFAFAVQPKEIWDEPIKLFQAGGFAYYGGVLGGAIGIILVFNIVMKQNPWKFLDIIAPALMAGLGIGRLGCFFAGCCHGAPAPVSATTPLLPDGALYGQIWWSKVFPFITLEFQGPPGVGVTREALKHIPLYPTQLWSAVAGCTLAVIFWMLWDKRRFDGQLAALVLIIEPILRIIIESFRADHRGYFVWTRVSEEFAAKLPPGFATAGESVSDVSDGVLVGLTTSQTIGLGMILFGVATFYFRWNLGVTEEKRVLSIEDEEDALLDDDED